MMRKLGGKLFAPFFFIAVMAMMIFLAPDQSLTGSQRTSIDGVFLSEDWIEESRISREIKDLTSGLSNVQQSVTMRRLDEEEPVHAVVLTGDSLADESDMPRVMGNSYDDEEDPGDHEHPYALGLSTVTIDEEDPPAEQWEEHLEADWFSFPDWVQGMRNGAVAHYGTDQAMDVTTVHPDEVKRVIEYTERVETYIRDERDEVRSEQIKEAQEAGEVPPEELDHGPMPVYSEIMRDIRRMNPDVVIIDMNLILDHLLEGTHLSPGVDLDDSELDGQAILNQTYDVLINLHRGNVDHFTTYLMYSDDMRERLPEGEVFNLREDLEALAGQFTIYNDMQVVHLAPVNPYEELRPSFWGQREISPLLTGE